MFSTLLNSKLLRISCFITIFLLLLQKIRWDPNPMHDGYVYSNALMVSQGFFPNRDFFAQYGPGTPILQGLFLNYFGNTLFNLRLLNLVLISFIALILYKEICFYANRMLGFLISVSWLSLFVTAWSWPSTFTTLFAMLSMFIYRKWATSVTKSTLLIALSSFLLTISIFFRVHAILQLLAVLFFMLLFRFPSRIVLSWAYGFGLGVFASVLYLFLNDSLGSYFHQCILWASSQGVYISGDGGTRKVSLTSYLFASRWYLVIAIELAVLFYVFYKMRYIRRSAQDLIMYSSIVVNVLAIGYLGISSNRNFFTLNASNARFSLGVFFAMSVLLLPFILPRYMRSSGREEIRGYVPFVIAFSTLPQLYSTSDWAHLWWIMPPLIVGFLSVPIVRFHMNRTFVARFFIYLAILSSCLSLVDYVAGARVNRVELSNEIAHNMLGTPQYRDEVDSTLILLDQKIPKDSNMLNVCPFAIFSVPSNRLLTYERQLVDWDPRSIGFQEKAEYVFICGSSSEFIDLGQFQDHSIVFEKPTTDPLLGTLRLLKR